MEAIIVMVGVINLPSAVERRRFQEQQLLGLELDFFFLEATSIIDISDERYRKEGNGWERPLRKSEVACFDSHKRMWREVARQNEPILVLEDDAVLSEFVPLILSEMENKENMDFVTLEVRSRKKTVLKTSDFLVEGFRLLSLVQDRTGLAAYVLWPSGAKKLLQKSSMTAPALADAFVFSDYSLRSYQVEPACALQLDQCESYGLARCSGSDSQISNTVRAKKTAERGYFSFRLSRVRSQLRLLIRQISTVFIAKKRFIILDASHFNHR